MDRRFADWLQGEIDRRGLGVAEAAREIDVSQSMLSNYLNAKQWPSRKSVKKVAAWAERPAPEVEALLPEDGLPLQRGPGRFVITTRAATILVRSPRVGAFFFGRLDELTDEELESVLPDLEEVVDRTVARRGEEDAAGGAPGAGGPP